MMKKFKRKKGLRKNYDPRLDGQRLICAVLIAPADSFKWRDPVLFTVDTGADVPVIPRWLLEQLEMGELPVVDRIPTSLADGSVVEADMVLINYRLLANDSASRDALVGVETLVTEAGDEPLIGLSILDFYNYAVVQGRLIILGPREEAWDELDDLLPSESRSRVDLSAIVGRPGKVTAHKTENPPSNVVPPMKLPKTPEPPKPLKPPGSTPPRPGGFLPPEPPIRAKKPK